MSIVSELSRRRVFRVAGMYGVVAWVIAQVAEIVLPALLLPAWSLTLVVLLLALGFPISMLLAWAFDLGPDGVVRTPDEPAPAMQKRVRGVVFSALLTLGTGALTWFLAPQLFGAGPERSHSIAVLPFENQSGDPERDYFCDGMSEEILNLLARVPGLKVSARTSAFAYKGKNVDIREVGRNLGVDTVLEGSVRWYENRVRITARLIDATSGFPLWSEKYDRELKDIFEVQDAISSQIVSALRTRLGAGPGSAASLRTVPPTADMDAYQLYLRARHHLRQGGRAGLAHSIEQFDETLEADPNFARAHAGLAAAWLLLPDEGGSSQETAYAHARSEARFALALDDSLSEAHAVLARLDARNWKWTDAEAGFFFAMALDPNDATARIWYSAMLRRVGRLKEALRHAQSAFAIDGGSPLVHESLARSHAWLGQNDKARASLAAARELGLRADTSLLESLLARRAGKTTEELPMAQIPRAAADTVLPGPAPDDSGPPQAGPPVVQVEIGPPVAAAHPDLPAAASQSLERRRRFALAVISGRDAEALVLAEELAARKSLDLDLLWLPEAVAIRRDPRLRQLLEDTDLLSYWRSYGAADACREKGHAIPCP